MEDRPTVFLFNDTQIVDESFLEDINNILSSGEVPNLFKPDELSEVCLPLLCWKNYMKYVSPLLSVMSVLLRSLQVCNALSEDARRDKVLQTPDSLFRYLIERVRSNLHVILCMSPVGELFRCVLLVFRPRSSNR